MLGKNKPQNRHSIHGIPTSVTERRVGNVGPLIIQAAKQGSKDNLEFLLTLPGAKQGINFTDKFNQTPLMIAAKSGHYGCVKILIGHGAEMKRKSSRLGQNQEAWQLAKRAGKTRIADYIQHCMKDKEKLGTTRAQLEATLYSIAANPKCSSADLERFSVLLQQLIKSCGYDVNSSDDDETPLLLIRATQVGNLQVVLKLLNEFNATPLVNDINTGESILHIACKIKSKLRFYFAKQYPELLRTRDLKGAQPLHVACRENDAGFVSWLFKNILAEESAMDVDQKGPGEASSFRRTGSLPNIIDCDQVPTSAPPVMPSRKSGNKMFHLVSPLGVSPLTSLPAGKRIQRPSSHDYTDGELVENDIGESPFEGDEGGLTFSFDSSRSYTISAGSSKSTSSRSRSNSPAASAVSGGGTLTNGSIYPPRTHRRAKSATPFESSEEECHRPRAGQVEQSLEENRILNLALILKESPLKISDVVEIRPFSVTTEGDSVFHILAREGYTQLLTLMLKVAEFVRRRIDLKIFVTRDRFSARLPIEEAIHAKNVDCVRLILQFTTIAGLLPELLSDQHLLKNAVFTNELDIVKLLIEYGFHKGLSPAVSLAMLSEYDAILRVLLHYQTQVVNALEFSRVRHNRRRTLDRGGIKWVGFQLENVNPSWLYDCYNAVDSVSKAFSLMQVFLSADDNHRFFQRLGRDCLHYFSETITSPRDIRVSHHLTQITEVSLSENQLVSVPVELFQLPSLLVLQLSHNQLSSLPSSDNPWERLYTSRISKLNLDWNKLETLPEGLFRDLANSLTELSVECNSLQDLPPGLWVIPKLKILSLAKNNLSRLHYLSSPQFFNDPGLTKMIASSFTINKGVLQCTKPVKNQELSEIEDYLIKLADYHYTVCSAKFCACKFNENVMDEVMGIHLCRMVFYHQYQSGDTADVQQIKNPVIQGQPLFPTNIEEESDSPLCLSNELEIVDLSYNSFTEVPWDLPCIAPQLKKLHLQNNQIQDLDLVHSMPRQLESLELDKNQLSNLEKQRPMSLPCGHPLRLLALPENNMGSCYCRHCKHSALEQLGRLSLDHNQLTKFPVVKVVSDHTYDTENPSYNYDSFDYLPLYPNLSILSIEANQLTQFPKYLHYLSQLSSLNLSHNGFHELPPEAGLINAQNLLILKMEGMFINNIPSHLMQKPTPKLLLSYLKALLQNSKPYRRIKLMVVGEGNKGKTSLLLNLTKKGRIIRFKEIEMSYNHVPLATVGVDLGDWEYAPRNKNKVTFMTWDFGGQEEYYATHQCFLTKRSLYILVWDIQDGETGVKSLKVWLENIEGCAPKSPVIIVGTHLDTVPQSKRVEVEQQLRARIQELYVDYSLSKYRYPKIQEIFFGNCHDGRHMDRLRDYIYNFVSVYKPPAPAHLLSNIEPLLEQPIPASYIKLQDIVRSLAHQCKAEHKIPIFNKEAYRAALSDHGYSEKVDELDQATTFLHENGILLHFDDSSLLSDLYFLDPQWLCSNLAKVITVQQKNPFQKSGFMLVENLGQILQGTYVSEFLTLMQKFEVILLLDERRLLIPSLLPKTEQQACLVFSKGVSASLTEKDEELIDQVTNQPHAPLHQTPYPVLARCYLLPFVPNGFFTRVTARLMSSDIVDHLQRSIVSSPLDDDHHVLNSPHWKCWRDGIIITWNHMEIFRIAPATFPLTGTTDTHLISSEGDNQVETYKGVEINIAVLPEEIMKNCSIFPREDPSVCCKGSCMATWLLHQATTIIDSVFEDWYEVFAKKKGFDYSITRTANPCPECFKAVHEARYKASTTPTQQRVRRFTNTVAEAMVDYGVISNRSSSRGHFYMFSSPHCSRALKEGLKLSCPAHGEITVADISPDLTFSDFPPSLVFTDPSSLVLKQQLGDGGFGNVFKGCLHLPAVVATSSLRLDSLRSAHSPTTPGETMSPRMTTITTTMMMTSLSGSPEVIDVAVKEFRGDMIIAEQDPNVLAEVKAWDVYQKASLEARVMVQLQHPHILGLVGLTLQPLRLVVELAPMGDLKSCARNFRRAGVRFSRKTIQTTLVQVAEALNYLHSRNFVYRDLKPENILVWKYPEPDTQWDQDTAIWVKVADYGISKQVSPQGLRGVEGTRPYLPPEVILHGGREAYSTKIDVYAFGMFMYYLITFMSPFEADGTAGRPITALLEEGKRPELPAKYHPQSLQLYELMCWCWSDKPQHRPTFDEVLKIIKTDSFTHLLEATPISRDHDDITAACINTSLRSNSFSLFQTMSVGAGIGTRSDTTLSYHSVMSMLSTGSSSPREDTTIQVWYGTEHGKCGVVNFHKSTVNHSINIPGKPKYISCVKVICGYVWICTISNGIHVYSTSNVQEPYASWGQDNKQQVYTLLHVEETGSVLALTRSGMYAFDSDMGSPDYAVILEPRVSVNSDEINNLIEGVVIPPSRNLRSTEVWVCSQSGRGFTLLHPRNFNVMERTLTDDDEREDRSRRVRHLQPMMVDDLSFLAVANQHVIERWDVENRLKIDEFDVMDYCKEFYEDQSRKGRVTSMIVTGELLYVGTGGGALLALNCSSMELYFVFHAYVGAVRSLLLVSPEQQTRAFTRLFSRKDSVLSSISMGGSASGDDLSSLRQQDSASMLSRRRSSLDSLMSQSSRRSMRSFESVPSDRSVLLSFGVGYRGVVGDSENSPQIFTLPSDGKKVLSKPARPSVKDGHLLLWSTEHCRKYSNAPNLMTAGSFQIDDVINECDEVT